MHIHRLSHTHTGTHTQALSHTQADTHTHTQALKRFTTMDHVGDRGPHALELS